MLFVSRISIRIIAFIACLLPVSVIADVLEQTINTDLATNRSAVKSQSKIDQLSDRTRKMLEQYRAATRQTDILQTYNGYIENLLDSQEQEKQSLIKQLEDIEVTQREIVPLILKMLENLETFIDLDLPFLPEERHDRLDKLKLMVLRADVTNAEKFRRVLEAYQIENDYGNTLEAYRSDIEINGQKIAVDFLRLGRVALYFQRLDGSETGYWDKEQKRWQILPPDYRDAIRNGLRIARKETAPDLLVLPVPAAEAEK